MNNPAQHTLFISSFSTNFVKLIVSNSLTVAMMNTRKSTIITLVKTMISVLLSMIA